MTTIVTRAGKGAALTWTEGDANITNLNNDKIENVVEDLTPQLGGDLDVNGKQIVSSANGNINIVPNGSGNINLTPATGHVTISATNFPTGAGSNGQVLTTDGTGNASWTTPSSGSSFDPASPGAIGGTTPGSGAFTTLSASTTDTTGALNVTFNPSTASGAAINASGKDSQGGTGYFDFFKITNTTSGATNPNKTFRVNNTGQFEIIDSTYSNVRLSLTDAGALTATSIQNTPIGSTTASTGRFTTLTATSVTNSIAAGTSAGTVTTGGVGALTLNTNNSSSTGNITINSGVNANIAITPNGTGKTLTYGLQYRESVYAIGTTTATSMSLSAFLGNIQTITVNASSFTLNTSGNSAGDSVTLFLTGGTTAPAAITQGTGTWKWAGGSKALSGVTGTTDIISIFYDGTTYYASINKGFV